MERSDKFGFVGVLGMLEMSVGDCFSFIQNGANIKQGEVDGGYPITRIETISNNRFNRDRMGYAGITDIAPYRAYVLEDGDILMSHINSVRYLGRAVKYSKQDNETIIHGMNLLRLKAIREIIIPDYACLYFSSRHFREQVSRITKKSVNQASFSVADLKRVQMLIAPLEEQKQIIALMSRIDSIKQMRATELEGLDQLIKARFVEMFGEPHRSKTYPYIKISELTDVVSGGTPDRKNQDYWNCGTIPWVKTTELQNRTITKVEEYITDKGLSESSAKLVPANTVLIAMYGQGKTRGMTGFLGIEASTNQACACILPTSNIDMQYLWHFLILSYDELRGLAQGGNQPNLNAGMIKNFPILVPPMEKQKQFVSIVSQVDKSKLSIQASLDQLETLKQSLMQRYFS